MIINILGTEYTIKEADKQESDKLEALNADGIAELWSKEIIIDANITKQTDTRMKNLEDYRKKVIRHEIMHCFFHESGLSSEARDEKIVEWFAVQIPKIVKAMKETGAM